jgi:hypothetical protein
LVVIEQAISGVGNPVVEINRDVERCILRARHLPGQEIWVLAPEVDVRPHPAMVEQDGPPITTDMNKRHEVLESRGGVDIFRRRRDEIEYSDEYL